MNAQNPSGGLTMRQQAEARVKTQMVAQSSSGQRSELDTEQILYELRVHQIELEMQNEELRRTQIDLDAARALYFDLYNLAPVAYFTLSDKGVILEVNLTASTLLGLPKGRLVARLFSQFIAKAHQDHFYLGKRLLLTTGQPLVLDDIQFVKANGAHFWGRVHGNTTKDITGTVVVHLAMFDCSEHKLAAVQLRESEHRWKFAIEGSGDGLWDWNVPAGTVFFSKRCKEMLGFADDEMGNNLDEWSKRVHPDDLAQAMAAVQMHLDGTMPHYCNEHRVRCKDGSWKWILDRGLVVNCDAAGKPLRMIGTHSDITERKRAEAELQASNGQLEETLAELHRSQNQLIQQEQLRGLSQLAEGIAHNFNNALSPIVGFTELLLKDPVKRTNQPLLEEWLKNIHTSAADAAVIVRQIHEFSLQSPLRSERSNPVDINSLIQQTVAITALRWRDQTQANGRPIQIETDLQTIPLILGDAAAIRGMLTNLIFNAVDSLPTGGTIRLATAVEQEFACLRVCDTGTGMTAEVRQQCFEPFFTTKGPQHPGLGLALVHSSVQRHSGAIAVASEPGRGTTFTIRFPLPRCAPAPTVPITTGVVPQSRRVLVVDDEPLLCEVVKAYLTSAGQLVETATNGAAALQRLLTSKFDLVLTDLSMPNMNGEQLAAAIHKHSPGLPVVLVTGFGDKMKAANKMPPHISAILSKPITEDSLRAALAEVLTEK